MTRFATLIGGIAFLAVAALALYRLFVGFPIAVGGVQVGQTSTFFLFVVCAALSLILLRGSAVRH